MTTLKTITLNNGSSLELECNDRLLDAVRFYFNILPPAHVTDDQIKEFVIRMCENAVVEAEKQQLE